MSNDNDIKLEHFKDRFFTIEDLEWAILGVEHNDYGISVYYALTYLLRCDSQMDTDYKDDYEIN